MKRWIVCSLFTMSLALTPAFSQGSGSSKPGGKPGSGFGVMKNATGKLTKDASGNEIKIEVDGAKLTLRITGETEIVIEKNGETKPGNRADLKQGRVVRVKYTADKKTAVEITVMAS